MDLGQALVRAGVLAVGLQAFGSCRQWSSDFDDKDNTQATVGPSAARIARPGPVRVSGSAGLPGLVQGAVLPGQPAAPPTTNTPGSGRGSTPGSAFLALRALHHVCSAGRTRGAVPTTGSGRSVLYAAKYRRAFGMERLRVSPYPLAPAEGTAWGRGRWRAHRGLDPPAFAIDVLDDDRAKMRTEEQLCALGPSVPYPRLPADLPIIKQLPCGIHNCTLCNRRGAPESLFVVWLEMSESWLDVAAHPTLERALAYCDVEDARVEQGRAA